MHTEAIAALQAALNSVGRDPEIEAKLGHTLALAGRRPEALAILDGLNQLSAIRYVSPYSVALVHAGLGDRDQALAWLEKASALTNVLPLSSRGWACLLAEVKELAPSRPRG